jgi:hypothetical protein
MDKMIDDEHAVHEAVADIPKEVLQRLEATETLSDEDRKTITEIARTSLAPFHKPEAKGSALSRVSDHITRVEVHLSDASDRKSGSNDKCCMMEARLENRRPIAVTHEAETLDHAVDG